MYFVAIIIGFQLLELLLLKWGLKIQGRSFYALALAFFAFLLPIPYFGHLISTGTQPSFLSAAIIVRPTFAWHFNWLVFLFFIGPVVFLARMAAAVSGSETIIAGLRWFVAIVVGGWGLLSVYGLIATIRPPKVEKLEISIPGLAKKDDGIRVVQLTDMHVAWWNSRQEMQRIGQMIENLKPDLLLITGDIVDHNPDYVYVVADCLINVNPRFGRFAILGNHDFYTGREAIASKMEECGFTMIRNRWLNLKDQGVNLVLGGMDDSGQHWTGEDPDEKRIPKILEHCPKGTPIIWLGHRPSSFDKVMGLPVALTLSGHTHGGQLRLPVSGLSLANLGFARPSGFYQERDQMLYVSRGTGTVGWPFRINCPEEITLITLRSPESSQLEHIDPKR